RRGIFLEQHISPPHIGGGGDSAGPALPDRRNSEEKGYGCNLQARPSSRQRPRRIGSSDALDREGEDIADAALGLDDARRARIGLELAPQAQNLYVDTAVEYVFVDAGRLQQVLAAQRALRRVEEGDQQGVFALGQGDRRALGIGEAAIAPIEEPAAK